MGKRFTILWVMVIVAVVAIDLGAVRAIFISSESNAQFIGMFIIGTIPMVNVLVAGHIVGLQCRRYPPFLRGFETSGATALVIYVAATWMFSQAIERIILNPLLQPLADYFLSKIAAPWEVVITFIFIMLSGAAILTLPQLAFAFIGGFIFHKVAAQETLVKEISRSSRP